MRNHRMIALGALAAAICVAPTIAQARKLQHFDIAAQPLNDAITSFGVASGHDILAPSDILEGKQSQPLSGDYSLDQALKTLLRGSGLHADLVHKTFVIRPDRTVSDTVSGDNAELVVTGTRIRGGAPTGSPVVVIDRTDLDRSGRTTVADMMQTIPQNFGGGQNEATVGTSIRNGANENTAFGSSVNLRGLGAASTLILFDGLRPPLAGANGTFADISLVPASALDRIELLTDGASAIYGSDAVAGVVNFRFRNRFEGIETRFRAATADGDFSDVGGSAIVGKRWATGGFVLAGDYSHRQRLSATDRSFVTEDLRPFGGPDNRSNYGTPGTIIAADGQIFGIPMGQNGTALTANQLLPGQQNRSDQQKRFDILPDQRILSAYLSADQDLGGGASLFVRGLIARRQFRANKAQYGQSTVTVPVTNAFYVDPIGTHQPIDVQYDFQSDFGPEGTEGAVSALSTVAGITGLISNWHYEIAGMYGREIETNHNTNIINTSRLTTALADSNPATAFNVFGQGGSTNPATIAAIRGGYDTRSRAQTWGGSLRIDGTLLDLPAGPAKLAFGVERRDDRLLYDITTDIGPTVDTSTINGLPGHRTVSAAYGELLLPLLSNTMAHWFPGTLDLSLAGRIERYSDVGRTTNPKFGVSWKPVSGLTFRGSYGTSFRAPYFRELVGSGQNLFFTFVLPNPASPTASTSVIAQFGFPDNLGPERARTTTLGFDLQPSFLPGLTSSVSWFRIDYRDRIATASLDLFNYFNRRDIYGGLIQDSPSAATIAALYASPQFRNPFNIAASSIGAIVNGYTMNLSRVVIQGLDFDIGYTHPLLAGTASIGVAGTRIFHVDQQVTSNGGSSDVVGMLGSLVKLRMTGRVDWLKDGFNLGGAVNYTQGYTNQTVSPAEAVRAYTTLDLHAGIAIPTNGEKRQMRLQLAATNVFDCNPPYVLNVTASSTLGYDPEQASPVGRTISVQAIIGW
jgi:iron complex outermembrane receptor protein